MNDPQANLPASDVSLNQNQSLDIAEEVLNEIAGTTSTTPITSKSSNLNPAIPVGSTQKEMLYPQTVEVTPGAGIAQVEVEPKVEISQDIEEFLKRVEDRDKEELKNIVIADESKPSKGDEALLSKDTIVIPFSQKIEKEAKGKNSKFAIAWLFNWIGKLKKLFKGKVAYQDQEEEK